MKFIAAIYAIPTGQEEVISRPAVMPSLPVLIVAQVGFVMARSAAILKKSKNTYIIRYKRFFVYFCASNNKYDLLCTRIW